MGAHNRESISINEKKVYYQPIFTTVATTLMTVLAWRIEAIGLDVASIVAYLSAFVLGGYAIVRTGLARCSKWNIELLIVLTTLCCAAIGYWIEGAILLILWHISAAFQAFVQHKNDAELAQLQAYVPAVAQLVRGSFQPMEVPVETLTVGDHVLVRSGARIPIDGVIFKGESTVDEVLLTGNITPLHKKKDDYVLAGTVNLNSPITVNVTTAAHETTFQQMIDRVVQAQRQRSPLQQLLSRLETHYIKLVAAIVLMMLIVPHYVLALNWSATLEYAVLTLLLGALLATTFAIVANSTKRDLLSSEKNITTLLTKY